LLKLHFDGDRDLSFETTGAVSTWRLKLNGKKNSYNINVLRSAIINLKYTAEQGEQVFVSVVKGLLKPYPIARFFEVVQEFPDEWAAFWEGEEDELVLPMSRDLFPNMSNNKITGIFTAYDLAEPGTVSMVLNDDKTLTLKHGKFLQSNRLNISNRGAEWTFAVNGDRVIIKNIGLVFSYKASIG
jgi:Tc toxin complex TcA C-terminal TcB-binding domain